MCQTFKQLIIAFIGIIVLANFVFADTPMTINYQGRLTDTEGAPVPDGPFLMKFIIWNHPTATDPGNEEWNSGFQSVMVENGLFSYQLGFAETLPDDIFSTGADRYLGITIGVDAELAPRTTINSSPYSLQSLRSDTTGYATDIADGCVTNAKIGAEAVTTNKIGYHEVKGSDIDYNAIEENHLVNYAVTTNKIDDYAVTTAKIDDYAVTSDKIGTDAVTTNKIAYQAVTNDKIAQNAVGSYAISSDAIGQDELAPNSVQSGDIVNGTILFQDFSSNGAAYGDVIRWNGSSWSADECIPSGVIMMWSGTLASIPSGWALCNGSGGTPNLTDRFIYSVGSAENPGASGGNSSHQHTVDPPNSYTGTATSYTHVNNSSSDASVATAGHNHSINISAFSSGSEQHLPPYYKLAFIMKQ